MAEQDLSAGVLPAGGLCSASQGGADTQGGPPRLLAFSLLSPLDTILSGLMELCIARIDLLGLLPFSLPLNSQEHEWTVPRRWPLRYNTAYVTTRGVGEGRLSPTLCVPWASGL